MLLKLRECLLLLLLFLFFCFFVIDGEKITHLYIFFKKIFNFVFVLHSLHYSLGLDLAFKQQLQMQVQYSLVRSQLSLER